MGSDGFGRLSRFAACFCGKISWVFQMENHKLCPARLTKMVSIKFYGCFEGGDVTSGSRVKLTPIL